MKFKITENDIIDRYNDNLSIIKFYRQQTLTELLKEVYNDRLNNLVFSSNPFLTTISKGNNYVAKNRKSSKSK